MANNIQAVIVLGVAFATSSCMATPYGRTPGERAQTQLAKALAGRVPGPPQRCLASFRTVCSKALPCFAGPADCRMAA